MSTAPVLTDTKPPQTQTPSKPTKIRKKSINGRPIPPSTPTSTVSGSGTIQRRRFSLATVERSIAAKIYFEHYFDRLFSGKSTSGASMASATRVRRRVQLEQELERLGVSESEKGRIRKEFQLHEKQKTRLAREKVTVTDFDIVKPLGRGAFGRVSLVKDRKSGTYYAMKMLKKEEMLKAHQDAHVRAERDMLTDAAADGTSQWIVKLMYSFQDFNHLYFVMEYLPGGDLLSLLITMDTFPEEMARFYAAEMILAIEETHRLGYVHRDIKPDNFLIDKQGHIRLADCGLATDFHWSHESQYYEVVRKHAYDNGIIPESENEGQCTHRGGCSCIRKTEKVEAEFSLASEAQELDAYIQSTDRQASITETDQDVGDVTPDPTDIYCHPPASHKLLTWRIRARLQHPHARTYSVVGTNNYIAPEILRRRPYDYSVDWWSLGVIIFEMLYGYPPFASKSRDGTRVKIMEWRKWLKFPPFVTRKTGSKFGYAGEVTPVAQNFVKELLAEPEDRLGGMQRLGPLSSLDMVATSIFPSQQGQQSSSLMSSMMTSMLLGRDAQMIKTHAWFRGFTWTNVQTQQPPWTPKLKSEIDTRYFDPGVDQPGADEKPANDTSSVTNSMMDLRKKLAFVGFTFKASSKDAPGRGHPKLPKK